MNNIDDLVLLGQASRRCLEHVKAHVTPNISPIGLDIIAEKYITEVENLECATKGYEVEGNTYSHATCISVNNVIGNGIPTSIPLQDGDILTVDIVVRCPKSGICMDLADTITVGEPSLEQRKLIDISKHLTLSIITKCLYTGKKVSDVGQLVVDLGKHKFFNCCPVLPSHFISKNIHEGNILHFPNDDHRVFKEGDLVAIEPFLGVNPPQIYHKEGDPWTVYDANNHTTSMFEHTVLITKDKPIILT